MSKSKSRFNAGRLPTQAVLAGDAIPVEMTPDNVETFSGEKVVVELLAYAAVCIAVGMPGETPVPIADLFPKHSRVGFDPRGWIEMLRENGYTVTVGADSITFTIVRG